MDPIKEAERILQTPNRGICEACQLATIRCRRKKYCLPAEMFAQMVGMSDKEIINAVRANLVMFEDI